MKKNQDLLSATSFESPPLLTLLPLLQTLYLTLPSCPSDLILPALFHPLPQILCPLCFHCKAKLPLGLCYSPGDGINFCLKGIIVGNECSSSGRRRGDRSGSESHWQLRCFSCCLPQIYIPQCLISGSLFQTSPFSMTIPQFQPLFQTLLLCTDL